MEQNKKEQNSNQNSFFTDVNSIKKAFSQLLSQFENQNKYFDKISENNENILKTSNDISLKVNNLMQLNFDILNKNENTSIDFTNKGTFNMDKQTIDFNDKIYNYDNELIITDKKSINDQIKWMENEGKQFKYPQGFEYCDSLLKNQTYESIIILSNQELKQYFYFILKNYNELFFDEVRRINGKENLKIEVSEIQKSTVNDIFPQGINYCQSLLNEQKALKKNKGCVRSFLRKTEDLCYWYYFKSLCINCFSNSKKFTENYFFCEGQEQCQKELELIDERNKKGLFPRGYNNCKNLIIDQMKINGSFFIIEKNQNNVLSWTYYTPKDFIEFASDTEIWLKNKEQLENEFENLNNPKLLNGIKFPQGLEYCKCLIQKQIKNGGTIHVAYRTRQELNHFYINI